MCLVFKFYLISISVFFSFIYLFIYLFIYCESHGLFDFSVMWCKCSFPANTMYAKTPFGVHFGVHFCTPWRTFSYATAYISNFYFSTRFRPFPTLFRKCTPRRTKMYAMAYKNVRQNSLWRTFFASLVLQDYEVAAKSLNGSWKYLSQATILHTKFSGSRP